MEKLFPVNEHVAERGLRVVVGLALIGLAVAGRVGAWGYLGVIPVMTGLLGSCPLYTLFGIGTCKVPATKS